MPYKFIFSLIPAAALFIAGSPAVAAPFDKDTPYQQAVPNFLDAIVNATSSVKDQDELNAIDTWAQSAQADLPEFLGDLLTIAQQLEAQGSPEFIFEQYSAFAEKWGQIAQTYPGLNELDPLISPLIDQLVAGLPQLQASASDNPLGGLYDLYKALEAEDPWGLGGLFIIEPVGDSNKEITVHEVLDDRKTAGVRDKNIVSRETVATLDGVVVYFELIADGQIVQRFVNFRDPSVIHEALALMIQNNEDPAVIQTLQELVDIIDQNILSALNNGVLDACSYSFIYRKVYGNVLQNCLDVTAETQDFTKMTRFDPFDDVNQVKLSEPEHLLNNLPNAGALSNGVEPRLPQDPALATQPILEEYNQGLQAPAQTFLIGILMPAYLLSVFGFFKGI